jgi:hypothetical protein
MGSVGYNYVKFRIRLREDPTHDLEDGITVFVDVKEVDGEILVRKRRMVFVAGTRPAATIVRAVANARKASPILS